MANFSYVIPTRMIYKDFISQISSMSSVDIDEDEIFKLMIESLDNSTWGPAFGHSTWDNFSRSYRCYGGWAGETTPDGEVLGSAIYNFQSKLLELLLAMGFVTAFGLLPLRYDRMIGGDMVLTDYSRTE